MGILLVLPQKHDFVFKLSRGVIPEALEESGKGRSNVPVQIHKDPSETWATMNGFSMLEDLTYHRKL
ncbi:hypothetical protein HAX54_004853, partial [Datura stramonium]|nr:hypothetical protein [Datura stramonium]